MEKPGRCTTHLLLILHSQASSRGSPKPSCLCAPCTSHPSSLHFTQGERRHTHTHALTHTHTHAHTHKHTNTHRHRNTHKHTHTETHTDTETHTQTLIHSAKRRGQENRRMLYVVVDVVVVTSCREDKGPVPGIFHILGMGFCPRSQT